MSLLFMNRVALGVDCDDCTPQRRKHPRFRILSNETTSKHYKTAPVDGFDILSLRQFADYFRDRRLTCEGRLCSES